MLNEREGESIVRSKHFFNLFYYVKLLKVW